MSKSYREIHYLQAGKFPQGTNLEFACGPEIDFFLVFVVRSIVLPVAETNFLTILATSGQ